VGYRKVFLDQDREDALMNHISDAGSPDWTMLITNPLCLMDYTEWLRGQDAVRTFSEEDIQIPVYDIPLQQRIRVR